MNTVISLRMATVYGAEYVRVYAEGCTSHAAHARAWKVMLSQEEAERDAPPQGAAKVQPLTRNEDMFTLPPVVKM